MNSLISARTLAKEGFVFKFQRGNKIVCVKNSARANHLLAYLRTIKHTV